MRNLIVPALVLVAGAVLGGGLLALTTGGDRAAGASPETRVTVTATPTTGADEGDLTVVVRRACVDAARAAERSAALLRRGVDALSRLDGGEVGDVLDEAQELQPEAERLSRECRGVPGAPSVSASPSPTRS